MFLERNIDKSAGDIFTIDQRKNYINNLNTVDEKLWFLYYLKKKTLDVLIENILL